MSTKLKVCGITRLEDARYAAAAGADYLGFIQYEKSARYVDPSHVREILEWVYGPTPVGVFVDAPADLVNRVAEDVGFALVQLHGDEPAFEVARIERPVIKAIRVAPDTTSDMLRRAVSEYEDVVDYFLLDTHSADLRGGTGEVFDWRIAEELSDGRELFLAGGINAQNVEAAITQVRPYAVDVSSALETEPGKKDFARIDAFMSVFDPIRAGSPAE